MLYLLLWDFGILGRRGSNFEGKKGSEDIFDTQGFRIYGATFRYHTDRFLAAINVLWPQFR